MLKAVFLGLVVWMAYVWLRNFLMKNESGQDKFKQKRRGKSGKSQQSGMDIQDAEYEEIE